MHLSALPTLLVCCFVVVDVRKTCGNYFSDTSFLLVGGLMVAVAVQETNLHMRLALFVLLIVGGQPRWLILDFLLTTAVLSMFISNTATTVMMLPIAIAIVDELARHKITIQKSFANLQQLAQPRESELKSPVDSVVVAADDGARAIVGELGFNKNKTWPSEKSDDATSSNGFRIEDAVVMIADPTVVAHTLKETDEEKVEFEEMPKTEQNLCKAILLSICYGANIGGTGT